MATVATQSTTAATNTGTIATNTTGLAKEAGGHLATIDTSTASTATNVATVNTTLGTTNTSLGTVVTQTGASGPLAKETGGNLATVATNTGATATSAATIATNTASTNTLLNGTGSLHLRDGTTSILATISTFHNGDNQAIQAAGGSILTAGVAQIQNPTGNGDAQRETGFDAISAAGVASGAQMMAQSPINVTLAASITGSVTAQAVALSSVTGTTRGVTWAIQKGMTLRVDTGASQEYVFLTALSGVNATGVFKNTHANGAVVQVFQYNQIGRAHV